MGRKAGFIILRRGQTKKLRAMLDGVASNVDVFREILTYLYPSGEAYPSLQSLSDESGYSMRTVKRAIVSIKKSGLLEEKGTNNRSTVWALSLIGKEMVE